MKWEELLCLATLPVAAALAFSGFKGLTELTAIGLFVATVLVATILIIRRFQKPVMDFVFIEKISCQRSQRYVGIAEDGRIICGDRKQHVALDSGAISGVYVKINSVIVSLSGSGIKLSDLVSQRLKGQLIDSFSIEISTRHPAMPEFTLHLLTTGKSRPMESLAVRMALTKAQYWLRNLRA
ncbi:hypothetical protein KXR64_20110 [Brucella intermedia]|uniref:hypothetical protein n=1 Tax=Brucella TaxID=234 RepID=UPI0009461A27|nr:hypothetical protein [Brucella intermedia]